MDNEKPVLYHSILTSGTISVDPDTKPETRFTTYSCCGQMLSTGVAIESAPPRHAKSVNHNCGSAARSSEPLPSVRYIPNFQRTCFEEAIRIFDEEKNAPYPRPDRLDRVVDNLATGLAKQFGLHWDREDTRTMKAKYPDKFRHRHCDYKPSLREYVKYGYPAAKGWSLETENPDLYDRFMKLVDYRNEVTQHPGQADFHTALSLGIGDVQEYLETVQDVMAWYMKHFYSHSIPQHARQQFREVFGNDLRDA